MSEHPFSPAVALRDRASGRFLVVGAMFTGDAEDALLLDATEASDVLRRFACEPSAVEVVGADELACRAVA